MELVEPGAFERGGLRGSPEENLLERCTCRRQSNTGHGAALEQPVVGCVLGGTAYGALWPDLCPDTVGLFKGVHRVTEKLHKEPSLAGVEPGILLADDLVVKCRDVEFVTDRSDIVGGPDLGQGFNEVALWCSAAPLFPDHLFSK